MNPAENHPAPEITRRTFFEATAIAAAGLALPASTRVEAAQAIGAGPTPPPTWPLVPYASGQPEYLNDLSRGGLTAAFASEWDSEHWRLIPFESDATKGTMIVAGQNAKCPELTFEVPLKGWHALYIGLTSNEAHSRLEIKLSGDPAFSLFSDHPMLPRQAYERGWGHYTNKFIQNYFWKYADLSGQKFTLRQVKVVLDLEHPDSPANLRHAGWVAYLKAVPMSSVEVSEMLADRKQSENRRLIATHDVTTSAAWLSYYSAEDIRRELEPYRNTDFFRMDWEGGKGDVTHFPSKIGQMVSFDWQKQQYQSFERLTAQSFKMLKSKGVDPLRVALEACHEMGMEFHASYRVSGFLYPPPRDERNTGGVFWRHPEWRGVGRDGKSAPRISYAFPEVRRWVVSLLREMATYPIDGITILYNRRPPVVEYEKPMVDSFLAKYGEDPRKLDEKDPRWLAHRGTFVTAFMQEVRQAMDEISGRKGGKRLQVSAVVMGTEERNQFYALDLRHWVRQGLVDWIIPYQSGNDLVSTRDSFDNPADAAYFVNLVKGTSCKVAPNLLPRELPPTTYLKRAAALYGAGVDGLYCWDTFNRCDYSDSWAALRRLGHRNELEAWAKAGSPGTISNRDAVRMLGIWNMAYDSAS